MTSEEDASPDGASLLAELSSVSEAQVVRQILLADGIPSLIKGRTRGNRYDALYDAFGMNVGSCALFVPTELLERAQQLLEESREAGQELTEDSPPPA